MARPAGIIIRQFSNGCVSNELKGSDMTGFRMARDGQISMNTADSDQSKPCGNLSCLGSREFSTGMKHTLLKSIRPDLRHSAPRESLLRTHRQCYVRLACLPVRSILGTCALVSLAKNDGSPIFQGAPDGWESPRFQAVSWLEVDSAKAALSRPTHPRVTLPVRRVS